MPESLKAKVARLTKETAKVDAHINSIKRMQSVIEGDRYTYWGKHWVVTRLHISGEGVAHITFENFADADEKLNLMWLKMFSEFHAGLLEVGHVK